MIAVGADVHQLGLSTAEIEHDERFSEDSLAAGAGNHHAVSFRILDFSIGGFDLNLGCRSVSASMSCQEACAQSRCAQDGRDSHAQVHEACAGPVFASPHGAVLQAKTVELAVHDSVDLTQQKHHESRANDP